MTNIVTQTFVPGPRLIDGSDLNTAFAQVNANSAPVSSTVTLTGVQTLTNKTLTSPTINTPTITAPTITGATTIGTGATITDAILNGNVVCTSAGSYASSTVVVNVTGLSVNVTTGGTYNFQARVNGTANTAAGIKLAMSGTASMTSSNVNCFAYNGTTLAANTNQTSWGSDILALTATYTDAIIEGSFVCQTGGTITLAGAQNASQTTATTIAVGSYMSVQRVS